MRRLFHCTVSLIYEDERGAASASSLVADRTEFWWNERKPDEPSLWESKIRLGEDFFNEIINHPVPLDMNTLTALKRSTLGLDLYLWLVYRTFALRAPLRLSWQQVYGQFGRHPDKASDKNTVQMFRRAALRELKKIKLAWPEMNYSTAPGVLILHPSTPAIAPLNNPNSQANQPFPGRQRAVSGLSASVGLSVSPPAPESSEGVNLLFPQACVISWELSTVKQHTSNGANTVKQHTLDP